ncbi:hypothetical protein A9Q81_24545 [Gammaproteobacteria bacterium 42_54_T18]|nr:hypothetical protein A9Q81_24545 [Gammaproteobacteria bacterium 42_54_T18]
MIVKEARSHHSKLVIDTLVEAFREDPVFNWISSNPAYQKFFFNTMAPYFLNNGYASLHKSGNGAMLWAPPNKKPKPFLSLKNTAHLIKISNLTNLFRGIKVLLQLEFSHPKFPHYYLLAIGTNAEGRGKGIGSALIKDLLRRCDEESVPAYLENTNKNNLAFYQGHGFNVTKRIDLLDGPSIWLMVRQSSH